MTQWFPIISYFAEAKPEAPLMIQKRHLEREYPTHGHDYHEMELIIEGSGFQWLNNVNVPFGPGSLFLLSPEDYHRVHPEVPVQLFSIHFPVHTAERMGFDHLQSACSMQLSVQETALFAQMLHSLSEPHAAEMAYYEQELQAVAIQMLARLLRSGTVYALSKPGKHLQQALKYIRAHHTDPALRVAEVAEVCGLSPCYFSSLFHQTVGCCFADYVLDCRLRHACALLAATEVSVTEIAYESGFASLAHFYRSFKKAVGFTPTTYRNARRFQSPC